MSDSNSQKLYCANCLHCKEFSHVSDRTKARERRVRCAAKQWLTPAGNEKTYSLHTVLSRRKDECAHYDSMGEDDLQEFIADRQVVLQVGNELLEVERIIEMPDETASGRAVRI